MTLSSLAQRLIVSILLIPVGLSLVAIGGWPFTLFITLILGVATWEYCGLFKMGGFAPATWLVTGGVVLLALVRYVYGFAGTPVVLAFFTLAVMVYHLFQYEKGRDLAATDLVISMAGILYLGFIGPYMLSLRAIDVGKWWFMVAMPAVWFADAGAFFIGRRIGKHKMSPRLSPKKSWEGYFGGIVTGVLLTALLAGIWHFAAPTVTFWRGALVGLVIAVLSPLGDLGESLLKRQFGVKDSSNILPGHGGVLDRIDSWLWSAVIGFYLITWLWV
jgi:phosphatidate cytidylyltransferase